MKKLLLILLCILLLPIVGEATVTLPAAGDIPHRTTCTAPCYIAFNATTTTSTVATSGYEDSEIDYFWTFGDASAGNFSYGAGKSKNVASGIVAAHVYETAGTYTWTVSAKDTAAGVPATRSGTITVAAADTTFSANTICVAANSLPVAGSGGCPAGATVANHGGTGSWPTAIGYMTTGTTCNSGTAVCKRVLLKRGDTFTGAAGTNITITGPAMIGAYGTGAKPVIRTTSTTDNTAMGKFAGTVSDLRFVDLDFDGQNEGKIHALSGDTTAVGSNILFLRIDIRSIGCGIDLDETRFSAVGARPLALAFVDGTISDLDATGLTNNCPIGLRFSGESNAALGSSFSTSAAPSEHLLRWHWTYRGVISSNTIEVVPSDKELLSLRALDSVVGKWGLTGDAYATRYVVISDNIFKTNSYAAIDLTFNGTAGVDTALWRNIVIERNFFPATSTGSQGVIVRGDKVTVRNNVFSYATGTFSDWNIVATQSGVSNLAAASNARIYNNTFYSARADKITGVELKTGGTGHVVKNNLVYAPNAITTILTTLDNATGSTISNNTPVPAGTCDILDTPSFDGALTAPQHFRIATTSCAANLGTAIFPATTRDFFNCDDSTANERIGALVPRARAQCFGVAGS